MTELEFQPARCATGADAPNHSADSTKERLALGTGNQRAAEDSQDWGPRTLNRQEDARTTASASQEDPGESTSAQGHQEKSPGEGELAQGRERISRKPGAREELDEARLESPGRRQSFFRDTQHPSWWASPHRWEDQKAVTWGSDIRGDPSSQGERTDSKDDKCFTTRGQNLAPWKDSRDPTTRWPCSWRVRSRSGSLSARNQLLACSGPGEGCSVQSCFHFTRK